MSEYEDTLKRKDAVISSLKKAVIDLSDKNSKTNTEDRKEIISAILAIVPFKTEEQRNKSLNDLANSDLPIEVIRETYEPLKKNIVIDRRDSSFIF